MLLQRLEALPVGSFHYKLLVITGLGWLFDAMDTGLIAFVLPVLGKEWGLSAGQMGAIGSIGLPTPDALAASGIEKDALVSPNWLISTYLVLTFAELFLSPMGISLVSKVAPPKYKGMMMGGWFAATAIGNYLVAIIGYLWGGMQLWMVWSVLIVCCLLAALFIFSIMKKLEKVA